ncbi:hypothetical protein O181_055613 [Austropuccinia psidii MF-1]|uniref:Uncharacterized protein n=1 Tax=Austropuccinia psidii MF-1 TaxID=1389203 RepID=A0A9Q3E858_9BASI|nr:hypothetical protein [Austropuccinia psidii MF-1]
MSHVHLRDLGFQRNQPEDREGLSRTKRPGKGHLGHSGGWQNNEGDYINPAIHTSIQQEPQTTVLEGYGSSSSVPPTPQRFDSMEHRQQEMQPSISLSRTWSKFPEDLSQRDRLQGPYGNHKRRTFNPDRDYSDSFRLTRSRPNQLSSGFKPFGNQQVSDQKSPFFTIPGAFQEKTKIQGEKQDLFQLKKEIVRPNNPEVFVFGERSAQELEVALNHSGISSSINRNITPTQIEHKAVSPESSLNSDALWLQMSQYAQQTQKQFAELGASHERMKELTASMDKIVKTLQEGHSQLSKASEETNKKLIIVFEEQHNSRGDSDCLDQDISKLFNIYHNMNPQPQGHVMDNPYHPDDFKADAILGKKERSPSQYQDRDNMSYSEKESLKQLPEASSWPKFCGTGEYDHIKLIDYIDGLFIDAPSIPDY